MNRRFNIYRMLAKAAAVAVASLTVTFASVGNAQGLRCCDLIHQSDHCFDDFISPMSNPVLFEDPRTLTEARAIFIDHNIPNDVLGGGDIQVYALQLRLALTERLSLIAVKDGYVASNFAAMADGWADVAAGLKYNLIRNPRDGVLLSIGGTYTIPSGESRTLQGRHPLNNSADGEFTTFLTGGVRIGEFGHWLSALGLKFPVNDDQSTMGYWSNHFDVKMTNSLYAFTEFNWYEWFGSGDGPLTGIEGLDFFNLGSNGVAGNSIVTQAVGGKYKPSRHTEIGIAYEFPLTERRDILDDRLTVDWIFRY